MAKAKSTRVPPRRFPVRKFFVTSLSVLLLVAIVGWAFFGTPTKHVDAQIAVLHSHVCLGGWKNPDKASGVPQVMGDSVATYDDENSATLANTMTQLFCGGFAGDIPTNVDRTKISLHFSWQMEGHEEYQKQRLDADRAVSDVVPETVNETASTSTDTATTTEPQISEEETETTQDVEVVEEAGTAEVQPEPVEEETLPPEEPAPVEEPLSWWRQLVPFAYAQEEAEAVIVEETEVMPVEPEVAEEEVVVTDEVIAEEDGVVSETASSTSALETDVASSTEAEVASSSPATTTVSYQYVSPVFDQDKDKENALFEVLFTIDNTQWHSLGYVSRISNDISFELPIDLFPKIENFNKLQISLESMERLEDTPKIYLDSMWVEVSFVNFGEDPLTPPGLLPGDLITDTYTVDEFQLITAFRNVSLETISNILVLTASTSSSTIASTSSATTTNDAISSTTVVSTTENEVPTEVALPTTPIQPTTTSATSSTKIFSAPLDIETKNILRQTPGVVIELWLHNLIEDSWVRVADNALVGTLPQAVLIENKVFWFGPYNSSLWMFDTTAKSYASQSISPNERVSIEYLDMGGNTGTVWFNPEMEVFEVLLKEE